MENEKRVVDNREKMVDKSWRIVNNLQGWSLNSKNMSQLEILEVNKQTRKVKKGWASEEGLVDK